MTYYRMFEFDRSKGKEHIIEMMKAYRDHVNITFNDDFDEKTFKALPNIFDEQRWKSFLRLDDEQLYEEYLKCSDHHV